MDKAGIGALGVGLVLTVLGGYAVWAFLPEVIAIVKGLAGIAVLLIGLIILVFGILIIKE